MAADLKVMEVNVTPEQTSELLSEALVHLRAINAQLGRLLERTPDRERRMTLIERLRELACSDKLTQGELETVVQALARIEFLQKELRDQEREFQREARDIAAEARWQDRNDADGHPYGTY